MDKGLIHLYIGDGKGKTTAAIGLAVRAIGSGYRVIFAQFLKTSVTGELAALKNLDATILRTNLPKSFIWDMKTEMLNSVREAHTKLFDEAKEQCKNSTKTLLILDEIIGAINRGIIDKGVVIEFLKSKPDSLEVVMTGRDAPTELIVKADYVSEIVKIKHPFDTGVRARIGIEM